MTFAATRPLKRLSRPEVLPPFKITQRVIDILAWIACYRFLSSDQIARLDGGSHQQVLRIIKLAYFHGLLDRPDNQHVALANFFDEGNIRLVYGLGRRGARILEEAGCPVDYKADWTTKNRRASAQHLAHTVMTAQTMVDFDFACRANGGIKLAQQHALLPRFPLATQSARDPFTCKLSVVLPKYRDPLDITIVPDRLFSFLYCNDTRHNFCLEQDRGTMDVKSRQLVGKSSFRRKQIGYFHLWKQRLHKSRWDFDGFRVATITTSEVRIARMIENQRQVTGDSAHRLFVYSTPERIAEHGPLGPAWLNGKGETISLID